MNKPLGRCVRKVAVAALVGCIHAWKEDDCFIIVSAADAVVAGEVFANKGERIRLGEDSVTGHGRATGIEDGEAAAVKFVVGGAVDGEGGEGGGNDSRGKRIWRGVGVDSGGDLGVEVGEDGGGGETGQEGEGKVDRCLLRRVLDEWVGGGHNLSWVSYREVRFGSE